MSLFQLFANRSGTPTATDEHGLGPNNNLRPILLIGAHPDDTVLGAAGLAALLVTGRRVVAVTATNGERGGDPVVRAAEDRTALNRLGVELTQWGLTDCRIDLDEATDLINMAIAAYCPSVALVHWPEDSHPDHRTLAAAARSAFRHTPCLLYYEGPTTGDDFKPALEVDISGVWEKKSAALRAYASEMKRGDFDVWADNKSRQRAWPRHKCGRCEAFSPQHGDLIALSTLIPSLQLTQDILASAND